MSQGTFDDIHFKAMNGQFNIDEAQGIVECFVAAVGNKDSVGDIVASGAFTESLKRRKPRVVWGHNWNDPIGKVIEIYEVPAHDPRLPGKMKQAGVGGLYAKVQFNLATEKGREAFASVAFFGGDQEWSIGYKTLQATFDPAMQANVLREVELYEVSPVLHGANQLTATISVKSDEGEKCHSPAMGAGAPMMPAVMRAFNPGVPTVNPLRTLERIAEDISNPREDIFAEGEARVLNPEEKYRLEQELMERSDNRLKIITATENMVTFHRMLPNGTSTAYRLPYHYDTATRQYMFGKPEKMGQGPDQPQPQTVIPMQMPSMPMSVKPNEVSPYTMVNGEYASEKSIEEKLHEVISGLKLPIFDDEVAGKSQQEKIEEVVNLLQSYIEEKSEPMRVVMKCEPHQAFYVKELLDPVIEYHGLEAEVSEKGVHLSGTFTDEVLDALYVSEKSIQRMFMKEGGWGKGDGPSGPTFQVEVKALGGRVGQRIGGGLSSAPPGMVWVDVTGAIDGDSDGIVFEGTPMQRPIIPRAMIPKAQAGLLQGASLPRAMQIERGRENAGSRSRRNNEDDGKKRKFRPRLSAEEVRISQEQKLRSNKIPKKRKPGPSADEWRSGDSRSKRNIRPDSNLGIYDPWKNRNSGTERLLGNEFSTIASSDVADGVPLRKADNVDAPKFSPLTGDSELLYIFDGSQFSENSTKYPNASAEIEIHDIGDGKFGVFGVIVDENGIEHLVNQEKDSLGNAFDFARSLGTENSYSQLVEMREAGSRRAGIPEQIDNTESMNSEVQELLRVNNEKTNKPWLAGDSSRSQRKPTLAYNTAAKSIREIFADENTWEPFFKDLNEVLNHSQNESQRLLDLYDDPNATEEAIDSLEQSIRDLDEQIAAVIDYAKMLNGENRRARLKKLAIPLVQKMIDERDGADYGDFTDEEIDLLRDRLTYTDQLINDIFGEEGSDKARKFVESMQESLDDAEWYDSTLTSPIEDEDNDDYLESPSQELYDEVKKEIEMEVGYIKDARMRDYQKKLAVSDGHNFTDSNSRSKRSFSNGRGVGESRQVFPSDGGEKSNKIQYARYDGRKQELLVEYSSGETITYGGITENMVSSLEKSIDDIDNAINTIKNDARYSIKANGEIDGRATSIATFVNRDIERLASYDMLTAKDRTIMQLAANAIASDFTEPPEHELLTLSDSLTGIANGLIRKYEENSAALNLLEIKDAIDDRIGNGLGGKRGTRMYRPLQKETTLDLTNDEIGELRDEIQAILNKHGDRMTFAPFAEFDKALKDAQDGNKNSVTIQDNLHSALTVAYDELYWMALNNQAEKKWLNPIGEAPLNLAAASGRFSSPRLKANRGDFNGVPFNNGAPSRMTPEARTALIDWANGDGSGLQVLRGIRDSHRTRNGNLTPRQWNTLASMYRRFGPGGSESSSRSKKDTEIYYSIVPSDIPEQLDDAVDGEVAETPKPSKPKGKPAAELLPDDFDSMTAKEKIDVMFQIGLATKDNPNGIMQEDWNRLIYPLDKELDVEEAVRNQAEFVAAQEAAAIRGEMLTEEEFYEQKSRQAELNDRRTIRHALSEYDAGRPELLAKLGLRRENFIVKADREFKAPTKPKPLGKWALDFSMKIRTQIEKAASNGLAGDEHLDPWLSLEDLINDNDGLLDEETIQKIIPVLEDYVSAYDGAEFGHRSEGNSYKQAQDMIEELENTLTILLDPTIVDDDSSDDEDKPKNPEVPTDSLAPDSSDSSSRSRRSSSEDLRLIIEPGNRRYPRNFRPNSRTPGFNDIDPSVIEYLKKIKYDLDKDKDKENSEKLSDLLFPGDGVVLPSRIPSNPDKYKDLTDEELISKAVGFQSDGDYPSDAFIHELSLRGYEVWKRRVIGEKTFGGRWVEDYDSFSVRPVVSPTQEHLDRRKSLYSPTEDVVDANEPTAPSDLPTLEVEEGTPKDTPSKPKAPKRPRSQEGPNTNQTGTNNINIGGDNSGDMNIVNEGVTTTVVNGRNVVIDVDGDIADKPLNEVDKELADIQEQLAELKNRRVGGSISDKEYAQRRVYLANKKIALKLRKYAVPNGDATKGAPTVSYSGSSSRSTRKIDYYRQEFNLSPEDLEFIKYTNANNEYLRDEFGIDDIAIEDIRSYVPPLDVVKNLDSLTDDDVNFLAAYDEKISELTERRNSFLLDMTEQYFLITNKIKQSGLSDEDKKSQIKEINDSFTEMMEQENESHLDSLKKVVLYSAPLGRNGAGWSMTPERIASLGLPVDYEDTLDREKYKIIAKILGEGNGVGPVQEFTGLQKSEIDALLQKSINHYFPNLGIKRPDIPGDGSFSRSKRETYRPLLGHTFEGYGQAEKKLSYSLEKLSKQNSAAKKLNDEEKNVIKKYFQIKNADTEPLRLLSDNDIKTLLNLISEEKLTTRNADLSAELLVVYRKEAEDLLIRELDIRSNPQKYKFGGNERKLENRFLSAKQLVDPKTMGVWETESLRAAWLYPDGRLYHVTVAHTKEHTYYDAFGDGLIRLSVSLAKEKGYKGRVNPPSLAIQAADTAPTAEQMKTLDELIDEAKVEEVFYQAGASSEIHNPNAVIRDDSTYIEGERSGTIKSGDLKKKLKQELNAVGWAKLPGNEPDTSSSRSKKDDGPNSDLSDEEFEIIDDFVNADIDSKKPIEEEPADFRTRRALARKREEFLKDAVTKIIQLAEREENFKKNIDAGEVTGLVLEKMAKMFAAGDYSIIDTYEKIVKENNKDVTPGQLFAIAYFKYASLGASKKLERQKGGSGKGKYVQNLEEMESRKTEGRGGFVLPELGVEDDLSIGEIDENTARKMAFYDEFDKYLPLHARIMGLVGEGLSTSKIAKQTGVPYKVVNEIKRNMANIAEKLGDMENWPLESLDESVEDLARLLPGDDMELNLDIAKRLKKARTFFENVEINEDDAKLVPSHTPYDMNRSESIILSFFEEGKPTPTVEEIAEALDTTFGSARGLLQRLRKKTGKDLKTGKLEENSNKLNKQILSLFKDVKNPPTIQEIMDATGLSYPGAYSRLTNLRETTGQKLSLSTDDEKINNTILSFFENEKKSPDMGKIMKETGLSYNSVHKRIVRLRKKTGRELKLEGKNQHDKKKTPDEVVLSLFENGENPPTIKEIAKELGVSYSAAKERLKRLRRKTGKELLISSEPTTLPILDDAVNQQILSLFENNENITTEQIAKATGLSVSAIKGRLVRLRKETGKELSISRELPPSLRDDISKTILSFFEEGEIPPTRQQLVDATGLSADGVTGRLQKLRKATGMDLSLEKNTPWSTTDNISKTILSLFEDSKNPPTHQQLREATGLSASALTVRLSKLRKETGERLPLTIKRPFKGRTKKPELEIIPPKEK